MSNKLRQRHIIRWADKFDLAKTRTDKHFNPHLFRQKFFHGDGSPAVKVTISWSIDAARQLKGEKK